MSDNEPMTPAEMAAVLYPNSPSKSEPKSGDGGEVFLGGEMVPAQTVRSFYPGGPIPPLDKRRFPSDVYGDGAPNKNTPDAARTLYGAPREDAKPHHEQPAESAEQTPAPEQAEPASMSRAAMAQTLYGVAPSEEPPVPDREQADTEETAEQAQRETTEEAVVDFDESAYDTEVVSAYRDAAKNLGVDDAAAQRLLAQVAPRITERQQEQLAALREQWVTEAKADSVIAGTRGGMFDANLKTARGVIERFGSDELSDFLDESGLGDNPELIRLLVRVGNRLGGAL